MLRAHIFCHLCVKRACKHNFFTFPPITHPKLKCLQTFPFLGCLEVVQNGLTHRIQEIMGRTRFRSVWKIFEILWSHSGVYGRDSGSYGKKREVEVGFPHLKVHWSVNKKSENSPFSDPFQILMKKIKCC